ncbi:hypothetical protein RDABS01_018288 [Bienertia sinuspersici]
MGRAKAKGSKTKNKRE